MKKISIALTCAMLVLLLWSFANAETVFEKREYESGTYVVGTDIEAGSYIVTVEPDDSSSVKPGQRDFRVGIVSMYMSFEEMIRFNKEGVVARSVIASVDEPQHITLVEGMAMCITKDRVKTVWIERVK